LSGVCAYPQVTVGPDCTAFKYDLGYTQDSVNFLIMGDDFDHGTGYNEDTYGSAKFWTEVNQIANGILATDPFKDNSNVNIFVVDDLDVDLGCTHFCLPGYDCENIDCSEDSVNWNFNACRGIQCDNYAAIDLLASKCPNANEDLPNIQKLIIFNSNKYGGIAGGEAIATTWGTSNTMLHEIGHLFGRLADEYVREGSWPYSYDHPQLNCDNDPVHPQWEPLIGLFPEVGTTYQGCEYYPGLWRGTLSSRMRDSSNEFYAINELSLCCNMEKRIGTHSDFCQQFYLPDKAFLDEFCLYVPTGSAPIENVPNSGLMPEGRLTLDNPTRYTILRDVRDNFKLTNYQRLRSRPEEDAGSDSNPDMLFKFTFQDGREIIVAKNSKFQAIGTLPPRVTDTLYPDYRWLSVNPFNLIINGHPETLEDIGIFYKNRWHRVDISEIEKPAKNLRGGGCDSCKTVCGDNQIQNPNEDGIQEQCEGNNLNGETCQSLGYSGGTLSCDSGCRYDLSGCDLVCGNGFTENVEEHVCEATITSDPDYSVKKSATPWSAAHDALLGDKAGPSMDVKLTTWYNGEGYTQIQRAFYSFSIDLSSCYNVLGANLNIRCKSIDGDNLDESSELVFLKGNQGDSVTVEDFDECIFTNQEDYLAKYKISDLEPNNYFDVDLDGEKFVNTIQNGKSFICVQPLEDFNNNLYNLATSNGPDIGLD